MDYSQILNFVPQDIRDLAIILLFAFIVWKLTRTEKEQKEYKKEQKEDKEELLNTLKVFNTSLQGVETSVLNVDHKLDLSNKDIALLVKDKEKQSETNKVTYANKEEIISLKERVSNVEKKVDEIDEKVK